MVADDSAFEKIIRRRNYFPIDSPLKLWGKECVWSQCGHCCFSEHLLPAFWNSFSIVPIPATPCPTYLISICVRGAMPAVKTPSSQRDQAKYCRGRNRGPAGTGTALHTPHSPRSFPQILPCTHVLCPYDLGKSRNQPSEWLHSALFLYLRVIEWRQNQVPGLICVVVHSNVSSPKARLCAYFFPRRSDPSLAKCHTVDAQETAFKSPSECFPAEAAVIKWQGHGIWNRTGGHAPLPVLSGRDLSLCHLEQTAHLAEPQFPPL